MFFQKFPTATYNFGNNESSVLFPNITAYVDIIDQIKQEVSFFEKFEIQDGERPDTTSQRLYGNSDIHWTFYFMNDNLRESGWPLPERELRLKVQERYPNRVVTTQGNIASFFLPGVSVLGKSSGTTGTIVERNLDLGQLVIKSDTLDSQGLQDNFGSTEQIAAGSTAAEQAANVATAISEVEQFNSVLYYKNSSGVRVDIDPFNQNTSGLTPVTLMEDNIEFNDNLKRITVIKPSQITSVTNEFFNLMRD